MLVVALVVASVSFAQAALGTGTSIAPASNLTGGVIAEVTSIQDTFTVSKGAAQKVEGVKLYKITLGGPQYSDQIRILILLLSEVGKSLNNPHAYIDLEVWYPGQGPDSITIYDPTISQNVAIVQDTGTEARLSKIIGEARLNPTVQNETTLYILSAITVPGGRPKGQQIQELLDLNFYAEVRM